MKPFQIPLQPGEFYHIFNRGYNLFHKNDNYKLRKSDEYVSKYIQLYAYCLIPNHFHLLVTKKEFETDTKNALKFQNAMCFEINQFRAIGKPEDEISTVFLPLFTSYVKAINKQENRHGSRFENHFKRNVISDTSYLTNLVFYIHSNPQMLGICNDFRQYAWSSYDRILLVKPSKLKKEEVIGWFTVKSNCLSFHEQIVEFERIKELLIE